MSEIYPEFDKDKAAEQVRRVLGWYAHLCDMPEASREHLVRDLVKEMRWAYGDGRSTGIDYACDQWAASMGQRGAS